MVCLLATAMVAMSTLASSVAGINYFTMAEAPDYNNKMVGQLLENVGSLREPGEAYAVFDWDNTCMFGDMSYTTSYYQVENLIMRLSPQDLATVFSLGYNASSGDACFINGTSTVIGQGVNGTDVTLATAIDETVKDYEVLYDSYIAPAYNLTNSSATTSLEDLKETTTFSNFRAKMAFLLYGVGIRDGGDPYSDCAMTVGMSELAFLSIGMTEREIRAMVRESIRWHLAQELDYLTFQSTGDFVVEGSFYKGLRLFNGQETVFRGLRDAGIDVFVISASPELYVLEVADFLGLGYMVPRSNVYGVRFKTDDAGLFTAQYEDDYPITWGPGKETVVNTILKPMHKGAPPIYASGDSDGDCEMISTVRDGIAYINNRLSDNSTCINGYYQKACQYFNSTEPDTNNTYLLQGQDQVIGSWITSGFTTEDGVTFESGVEDFDGCAAYQFLEL